MYNKDEYSLDELMKGGAIKITPGQAFTKKQKKQIRDIVFYYGGDRIAASRYLGISKESVENHASDLLESQHLLSNNKRELLRLVIPLLNYSRHNVNLNTGISPQQINQFFEEDNIIVSDWAYTNAPPLHIQNEVLHAYDKLKSVMMVSKLMKNREDIKKTSYANGFDPASISKVLKVNGIELNYGAKSKDTKIKLIKAFFTNEMHVNKTAEEFDVDPATVNKTWFKFHVGSLDVKELSYEEIYEKYKDEPFDKKEYKKQKALAKKQEELNFIRAFRIFKGNQTASIFFLRTSYGRVFETWTKYNLFDPKTLFFDDYKIYNMYKDIKPDIQKTKDLQLKVKFEKEIRVIDAYLNKSDSQREIAKKLGIDQKTLSVKWKNYNLKGTYFTDPYEIFFKYSTNKKLRDYYLQNYLNINNSSLNKENDKDKKKSIVQKNKNVYSLEYYIKETLVSIMSKLGDVSYKTVLGSSEVLTLMNTSGVKIDHAKHLISNNLCRSLITNDDEQYSKEAVLRFAVKYNEIKSDLEKVIFLQTI